MSLQERVAQAILARITEIGSEVAGRLIQADEFDEMCASQYARAALSAMPQRLSPDLIAQLNKLASRLTQMGEYDACDLIDTVVARVTAMPGRELLAEALDALDRIVDFHIGDCPMTMEEIDFAKNINWQIRKTARAAADKIRAAMGGE